MKSFQKFQYQKIITQEGRIANGDFIVENGILTIRTKNGYLNDLTLPDGVVLPAVENEFMTHIEHWKEGVLHCETEPAIIDTTTEDGYEEWWLNGKKVDKSAIEAFIKKEEINERE